MALWHLTLLGAPTDAGAGVAGAHLGPDALRGAGLARALRAQGHDVQDLGNLAGPPTPAPAARHGPHHLACVSAWNQAVHDAVAGILAAQRLPVLLGGDHSLAVGSISAVARHCRQTGKALCVLWVDAHADANTPATSPSGNLHGMPVACLLGAGAAGFDRNVWGRACAARLGVLPDWPAQRGYV